MIISKENNMKGKLGWQECTIGEAFDFAMGKTIYHGDKYDFDDKPNWRAEVVRFTDGTAVACCSDWSGPLSEVTPDIDAQPPIWWIGNYYEINNPKQQVVNGAIYCDWDGFTWLWDKSVNRWIIDCERSGGPPSIHEKSPSLPPFGVIE